MPECRRVHCDGQNAAAALPWPFMHAPAVACGMRILSYPCASRQTRSCDAASPATHPVSRSG